MNPISRLRTRARSEADNSATGRLFRKYCPSVGESSRPRIDSSVDLPHPDGPAIDTYSPLPISMWMPDNACVSTSSVKNTFVTPSSLISGCPFSAMLVHLGRKGPYPLFNAIREKGGTAPFRLFQSDAVVRVVSRHVGENHLIADLQAAEHFDGVHRAATELHLHALGGH